MEKINSIAGLRASIFLLEIKQANEGQFLKEQAKITYESLKPVNLIRSTLNELVTAPDVKGNILIMTASLAAGYLSKRAVIGATNNPLKLLFGSLLQMGVSSIVSKNTDEIKSVAKSVINTVFNKKRTPDKNTITDQECQSI